MPKSKHRKSHSKKLADYKANKKRDQELLKKKLIDNYIKMQQEALANQEAHTSTEEVSGPEINIDELNGVASEVTPEFETIDLENAIIENSEAKAE
jgi:hypothetical protein